MWRRSQEVQLSATLPDRSSARAPSRLSSEARLALLLEPESPLEPPTTKAASTQAAGLPLRSTRRLRFKSEEPAVPGAGVRNHAGFFFVVLKADCRPAAAARIVQP